MAQGQFICPEQVTIQGPPQGFALWGKTKNASPLRSGVKHCLCDHATPVRDARLPDDSGSKQICRANLRFFAFALVHPRCSRRPRASMLHGSTLLARSAETPGSRATVIRADRKTGRAEPGGIFGGAWNSWPSRRACSVTSDRLCPPVMGGPHPGHPGRLGSGTARRSHRKALPPNGPLSVRGIAGSSPSLPI